MSVTQPGIDHTLLEQMRGLADKSATPLAEMSMEDIAGLLGMTRMTLYRRGGTREQIVNALQEVGVDARRQPDVYERVVTTTSELLRERPIVELTLELIASRAGCSVPAIHARFGGRQGVLIAVIERHSPLFPMRKLISTELDVEREKVDLHDDIHLLYGTLFPQVRREWKILRSFIAEVLRDPGSDVGEALRNWYLPQVSEVLVPLIRKHVEHGTMRDLPVPIIVQYLVAPVALHVASREVVIESLGIDLPGPDATVDLFTEMFCRAAGTEAPQIKPT